VYVVRGRRFANDPAVTGVSGGYFVNCKRRRSAAIAYDRKIAESLWQIREGLTGIGDCSRTRGTASEAVTPREGRPED
jgi:hypothetical protein